jgi:predicted PhzF superfamily epimerase YddE/YHI9
VNRPLYQVDAFTAEPFAGNPAAVCLLESDAEPAWMQRVAAEMNLSETAFLRPGAEAGRYGLRWFTPTVEVELCGHATLASAHVLWSEGRVGAGAPIRFDTASGPLATRPGADGRIWLDFPATPAEPADPPPGMLEALGAGARWVGLGRFVSRYFAPAAGIDEDPVTGSAHCTLGPFWAGRLGRDELTGFQASVRGGLVQVHPRGDRVLLGGHAVTVLRGQLVR